MANPTGYGRIVRDQDGLVSAIVEEKDASSSIKRIAEINTGIMVLPTDSLSKWLKSLRTKNVQGEYYLTDVIAMAVRDGVPIRTSQAKNEYEILGVNSRDQLASLERQLQKQQASALLELGVTLFDPERIDIRGELVCGQDVWIDIGCVFEGRVQLANGVHIGPYCVIKDSQIAANTEVGAFTHIDGAQIGVDARVGPYARIRPGTIILSKLKIQGLQHRVKQIISPMWATRSLGRASILVLEPLPVTTMVSISTKRLLRMMLSLGPIHS
jgi:bifunctional UDP-N-acetylglucosamine pyrophosphorylase/glucosamine-1-phosphate N-acetyltransferase